MPCGVVLLFRVDGGRLVAKRVPCRTKSCETCGPKLRAQWAGEWAHAIGPERVYRLVIGEDRWEKLRRRKVMRTAEYGVIPGPDGTRVVYTTADVGEEVEAGTLAEALARDFAAMPNNNRRRILSANWRQVIDDAHAEAGARRAPLGECLGQLRRSLAHVAMVAADLGALVQQTADMVVMEAMDPPTFRRFVERVGVWWFDRGLGWAQRGEATAA
jgi:hypothetical protein